MIRTLVILDTGPTGAYMTCGRLEKTLLRPGAAVPDKAFDRIFIRSNLVTDEMIETLYRPRLAPKGVFMDFRHDDT